MSASDPLEDDGMEEEPGQEPSGEDALHDALGDEALADGDLNEEALSRGEASRPLPADERESVEADLQDLKGMRVVLEPQGAKGGGLNCTDCVMDHYLGWQLLR